MRGRIIDITGQKFNRLTAIEYVGKGKWLFQCDCGQKVVVAAANVKNGNTMSCGCLFLNGNNLRHGGSGTREYSIWKGIKARCLNPNIPNYNTYGGRGIKVCDRWLKFENFLADMGKCPGKEYSLDRINNDGDYCPENCRWATWIEQCNNQRKTIRVTINGQTHSLAEWCRLRGADYGIARRRYVRGVRGEDLFMVQVHKRNRNRHFSDDEIRFIRSNPFQYEYCKSALKKDFSKSTYDKIVSKILFTDVI